MCGISGLFHFDRCRPADEGVVRNMRSVLRRRGPDDSGEYIDGPVGLGFNRLSIIDVAGGHQPMSNEDGTAWIVFNGEIYNFVELREELIRCGYRFQTRSDTETILHAWDRFGDDCVHRLRGMFAFAIWDERRKTLFAARDRMGIKPLYYFADRELFAFASEIKSLLQIPEIPREVDTAALADYLRHGYVLTPNTIFRNIRKLPPAHTVTVNSNGIAIKRYWEVPIDPPRKVSEGQAIEEFHQLMDETTR